MAVAVAGVPRPRPYAWPGGPTKRSVSSPPPGLSISTNGWHHFEALLRLGRLDLFDPCSFDASLRNADNSLWTNLARRRIRARLFPLDKKREAETDLGGEYQELIDAYDRAGLPVELRPRALVGTGPVLMSRSRRDEALSAGNAALEIARRSAHAALGSPMPRLFLNGHNAGRAPVTGVPACRDGGIG